MQAPLERTALPVLPVVPADRQPVEAETRAGSEVNLERAGWTRRFVAAEPRLHEMVELYRSLGLDVRLEPAADRDLADECAGCALAHASFRCIYTRRTA